MKPPSLDNRLSPLSVCERLDLAGDGRLVVDFLGRSNLWIDGVDEASSVALTRHVICEALTRTSPGQLDIVGYDSDLSGVFAPFAILSSGEAGQLALIDDEAGLKFWLARLKEEIRGVQNVIQGRAASITAFRRLVGRPVEGYRLVVLSLDMGMISVELRGQIALLMKSGPAAGVTFVIVSTTMMSVPTRTGGEVSLKVEDVAPNVCVLEPDGSDVGVSGSKARVSYRPKTALECLRAAERSAEAAAQTALPTIRFDELHDLGAGWGASSADGVTFTVGKYGVNDVSITLGDEVNQRHNALITGAVGQGKSNLISVIIHSLCLRYPPEELRLYLLDFKEGVTFRAFSAIGKDDYLPHAATLGLECDVDFGIAVLESLFSEYRRRMAALKEAGARSIRELRRRDPSVRMPRIVVVIDEFQMMFGDDMRTGQAVADLLERSVRLFRAAGIHFILSSQTLGGSVALAQKRDAIFSQVPVRLALRNSVSESLQTLGPNNPAAAYLRPREAVVNLDYGEPSQNRKTVIAYADEAVLAPLRRRLWERARRAFPAPYVFESERRVTLGGAVAYLRGLRGSEATPTACLGDRISVDGQRLAIPLPSEPGRNIAVIGTPDAGCNCAAGMLQSAAASLAYQHPKGDARFLLCDLTGDPVLAAGSPLDQLVEGAGYFVERVAPRELAGLLQSLLQGAAQDEAVYVIGAGMDRWEYERDPYGQGSPLKDFVERGPSKGLHFVGWWVKASSFTAQVAGYGNSDAFNTKVFLRVDERTVQGLTSPFVRWSSRENRALASDAIEFSEEVAFVPYAPVGADDVAAFRSAVW